MRDRDTVGPDPERWNGIRRCLPDHARVRLFDPAIADLEAARLRDGRGLPTRLQVSVVALDCFRLAVPRVFVRDRRPTRAAWILVVVLVALAVISMLRGADDSTAYTYTSLSLTPPGSVSSSRSGSSGAALPASQMRSTSPSPSAARAAAMQRLRSSWA